MKIFQRMPLLPNKIRLWANSSDFISLFLLLGSSFIYTLVSSPRQQLHLKVDRMSFRFHILRFLLFFISIGFATGQVCNPSSCGGLQISYPFRLKGDLTNCGRNTNYELTCSGNRTFLQLESIEYFVKHIDYVDSAIQIVDVGLLKSNCSLPLKSVSPYSFEGSGYYQLYYWSPVSLMNCSKKISSQEYQFFPCLSKNNSYVYAISGYFVSDLLPSCSFLTMIPSNIPEQDLFQAIHVGFFLTWSNHGLTTSQKLSICLGESSRIFRDNFKRSNFLSFIPAIFKGEMYFPYCIHEYRSFRGAKLIFVSIAIIAVIEIVQLVILWIVWILMGRFVFSPITLCIFLAHKFRSNWASKDAIEKFLQTHQSLSPTRYAYTDIIAITRHFKEQLGKGGFGSVYKGEFPGGHFVAVKMLVNNSKCNGDEFISEVSTIGRIHHLNVVRLVGFCSEGSRRGLIYEYMPNGSLDKYIFSTNGNPNRYFSWEKLNNIALGVARGIDYLHRGCHMTILHFDIKPQNILLDQNFTPKVSDFGLAKLYPKDYNVVSISAARGTIGYIAPELVSRNFGIISHKSDVYSFGMLLMEMAAGRRNVDQSAGSSSQIYYPSFIYDKLKYNESEEIMMDYGVEMKEIERKLYLVGLWCIQIRPSDRPSMNQVVHMLEGAANALQLPSKPFMSTSSSISTRMHSDLTSTTELAVIDEADC